MTFCGYRSRWDLIIEKCFCKDVLHLGCIGITEGSLRAKVKAMLNGSVLHAQLRRVTKRVIGIDHDLESVKELNRRGFSEILYGDVLRLEEVGIGDTFDVILVGDLIEHLSGPGRMLEGIKRFMHGGSELIVTTPNSFGLLHFLRYCLGVYREGNEHVLSFNLYTLQNLLFRHGYFACGAYTCYNRPPSYVGERLKYGIGISVFKAIPKFGGTICVVAKLQRSKGF